MKLCRGLIGFTVLYVGCLAMGQQQLEQQETVTRVYDIRSMLSRAPDYPLRQRLQQDRNDFPPRPEPPVVEGENLANDVIKLITTNCAPESWRDAGGRIGAISAMKGQLIITQTMENHQVVSTLLEQLRNSGERTVRLEASWLLLSDKDRETLQHPAGMDSLSVVPEATMKSAKVYARGQTTGFNGQQVHIASHGKRTVIADLQPSAGGYDPVISMIPAGLGLQVRPQLNDAGGVILDVFNEVLDVPPGENGAGLAKLAASPTTRPAAPLEFVDTTRSVYQTLRTTIRVPLGQPVIIGGMTLEPPVGDKPAKELYLVIKAEADQKTAKKTGM